MHDQAPPVAVAVLDEAFESPGNVQPETERHAIETRKMFIVRTIVVAVWVDVSHFAANTQRLRLSFHRDNLLTCSTRSECKTAAAVLRILLSRILYGHSPVRQTVGLSAHCPAQTRIHHKSTDAHLRRAVCPSG